MQTWQHLRTLTRFWLLAMTLCGALINSAAAAVAIPPYQAYVTDLTGTLSSTDKAALEQRLRDVHQQRIAEIAILLVPTTADENIFTYSMRIAEQWKVGDKTKDDGVLLVIAKDDRTSQILVGYGLEGSLTDVASSRILRDVVPPFFRRGDFSGGLHAALDSILATIQHGSDTTTSESRPVSKSQSGKINRQLPSWYLMAFVAVAAVGRILVRKLIGKFLAGIAAGGAVLTMGWLGGIPIDWVFIPSLFMIVLVAGDNSSGRRGRIGGFGGGFGGSGRSGGFGGGGGGSFGGGGASGRW